MPAAEPHPDLIAAWKRERRIAIRRFHPDRGGEPADLLRALAAVDHKYGRHTEGGGEAEPQVLLTHSRTYLIRLGAHRLQQLIEAAREHIPRRWPGARRSTRL